MGAIVLFKDILNLFDHITKALFENLFFSGLFGVLLLGLGIAFFVFLRTQIKR